MMWAWFRSMRLISSTAVALDEIFRNALFARTFTTQAQVLRDSFVLYRSGPELDEQVKFLCG
jgi:hypothetical protein